MRGGGGRRWDFECAELWIHGNARILVLYVEDVVFSPGVTWEYSIAVRKLTLLFDTPLAMISRLSGVSSRLVYDPAYRRSL